MHAHYKCKYINQGKPDLRINKPNRCFIYFRYIFWAIEKSIVNIAQKMCLKYWKDPSINRYPIKTQTRISSFGYFRYSFSLCYMEHGYYPYKTLYIIMLQWWVVKIQSHRHPWRARRLCSSWSDGPDTSLCHILLW